MESTMGEGQLTIGHVLRHGAAWYAHAEVVTHQDGIRHASTFGDVAIGAARLAGGLRALGIEGDARVGTLMWNTQAHLEAYLAVPAMGAVLHSANLRLFPEQLALTINQAEDQVLLVDPDLVPQLLDVMPLLETVKTVVVNGSTLPDGLRLPAGVRAMTYGELLAGGSDTFDWPDVDERSAAAICFTTGTTGDPKGVVYSHRSIVLQCLSSATMNALRIGNGDRVLMVVPMFHATAWGYPYAAFWFGADLVLPSRHLEPSTILDLVEAERITFANGVPTIWNAVAHQLRDDPERNVSSLDRVVIGGAAMPAALVDAFADLGVQLVQGWGMTETSPLVSLSWPDAGSGAEEQRRQSLTQGRVLAGVDVRLRDPETGDPVAIGGSAVGELELRGPWVADSYLGGVAAEKFSDDGWLRTGDIGTVDHHGFVRLTDRSKDIIKSGGEWISSVDLENCLLGHPDLLEAAVIGVPDERWDERPCAVVVPAGPDGLAMEDLRGWLVGRVAKFWIPERWVVAQAIPRTSVGKIDKKALRASYHAGEMQLLT